MARRRRSRRNRSNRRRRRRSRRRQRGGSQEEMPGNAAAGPPAGGRRRRTRRKKRSGGGKYGDLIMKAIDEKPRSSLPDIKKWIRRNCDYSTSSVSKFKYINKALKTLCNDGTLIKVKGKWRRPPPLTTRRPKSAMKGRKTRKKSPSKSPSKSRSTTHTKSPSKK